MDSGYLLTTTYLILEFKFNLLANECKDQSCYKNDCITYTKLAFEDRIQCKDSAIHKLFSLCEFAIEINGFWPEANKSPTCTLYISDEFRVRVSCIFDAPTIKALTAELKDLKGASFQFAIDDQDALKKFSADLLSGIYQGIFVKNIDKFRIGTIKNID